MSTPSAPFSLAAERNKQPLLERLRQILPAQGKALEVASGAGQHAAWFAAGLPDWVWQPTEANSAYRAVIAQHTAGLANVRAPLQLDLLQAPWLPVGGADDPYGAAFDAIFCANLLHITAWPACGALMRGSAQRLAAGGMLLLYGPMLEDGTPTAPSNQAFDHSLRARNPEWGLRHLSDVQAQARAAGLHWHQRHAMPANNLLLVWRRGG